MNNEYDIAIIGGGIVGLAHAFEASKRGLKTILFERNQFALGASIRNFGLVWPIGQKGALLDRALRSRKTWLELSEKADFFAKENGSLHLAYHDDEWRVLQEFVDFALGKDYELALLDADQIKNKYAHVKTEGLIGGLESVMELTVDPRQAIKVLAEYLGTLPKVELRFGTVVTDVDDRGVATFDQFFRIRKKVIICSGADFETLFPQDYKKSGLIKCKLQMMRTKPVDFDLGSTLCAGLTLRHYDSFSVCPSVKDLSDRYHKTDPRYHQKGIHVLLAQNERGELVIGDSHEYGSDHHPFDQVAINETVLDYLRTFFTRPFEIKETWHGIYPKLPNGQADLVHEPIPGVLLVNGLGGAGMTLSFGLAEENFEEF